MFDKYLLKIIMHIYWNGNAVEVYLVMPLFKVYNFLYDHDIWGKVLGSNVCTHWTRLISSTEQRKIIELNTCASLIR